MPRKEQGQIWWTNLPEPLGWRPVLIITRSDALPKLLWVTVAPLTRTIRGIESEVVLEPTDGVPERCAVSLDNIATVEQDLLVQHITTLSAERMNEVWEALHYAFDLPY
jgi:mRNA interferase MazF